MQVLYLVKMNSVTMPNAVGSFLASFRKEHDLTLEQIARTARDFGASWSASSVRNIENGKAVTSLPNLLSLGLALNELTNSALTLSDLIGDATAIDGPTSLGLPVKRKWVDDVLRGAVISVEYTGDVEGGVEMVQEIVTRGLESTKDVPPKMKSGTLKDLARRESSLAEQRAAQRLKVDVIALKAWAHEIFGQTLEDEAAERAAARTKATGKPVTAQTRGAMTRQIIEEIRGAIEGNKNGTSA